MISYHLISKVGERDNNEDSVGMFQAGAEYCFALADGLGGHGKGEVASRIAVEQAVAAQPECDHIRPLNQDLNDLAADGGYHLVAANPPYFTGGYVSPEAARATARHEGGCTLEQVAAAAARLLRDGGRFALCNRPEHLARTCCILSAAGLEPKRLVFAKQTPKDAPWLFLLEAQKNRKPGLRFEPDIYMADETGRPSLQLQAIYRQGM